MKINENEDCANKGTKCDDFEEKTPKVRPRRGPGTGPGAPGRGCPIDEKELDSASRNFRDSRNKIHT